MSYPDTVTAAFDEGPMAIRKFAPYARYDPWERPSGRSTLRRLRNPIPPNRCSRNAFGCYRHVFIAVNIRETKTSRVYDSFSPARKYEKLRLPTG